MGKEFKFILFKIKYNIKYATLGIYRSCWSKQIQKLNLKKKMKHENTYSVLRLHIRGKIRDVCFEFRDNEIYGTFNSLC